MKLERKQLLMVAGGLIALVAVWALIGMIGSGWVKVTAPAKTQDNAVVTVKITGIETDKDVKLKAGESKRIRLKKGVFRIEATAGTLRAIDIVQIKGFSTTKLTTPTGEERGIKQLANNVTTCLVPLAEATYSYGCGSGTIARHLTTATRLSLNSKMYNGRFFNGVQPLKNGLVGFATNDAVSLEYLDLAKESTQPIPLPADIKNLPSGERPQVITANESGVSRFGLLSSSVNKFYLYKDVDDPSPTLLEPAPAFNNAKRSVSASYSGSTLVLYDHVNAKHDHVEGVGEGEPQQAEPEQTSTDPLSYIFEYDTSGKQTRKITLPEGQIESNFYKILGDFYIGHGSELGAPLTNFYHYKNDKMNLVYSLPDTGNWITVNNKAYLQVGSTLYEFVPGSDGLFGLHSLFYSNDITVAAVFAGPSGVVFAGAPPSGQQLNAYQLLDTKQDESGAQAVEPKYEGLDQLLDRGLTRDHISNIKYAIGLYGQSTNTALTNVVASNMKIQSRSRANPTADTSLTFTITLNDNQVNASVMYEGFAKIRMRLTDNAGKQLYDSGDINYQNTTL